MKRFTAIPMILLLVVLLPAMAAAAAVGTVTQMTGRADVTGPDRVVRPLRVGDAVAQGDIVRTKSGAKVEITFEDGSVLRLAPVTRVEISEYVSTPTETRGLMSLLRGKIQSIVNKTGLFGMGRSNRYEVHTATAVCGVRGTNFWVSYQGGVSNMVFKTGAGYTYSKSKPGEVRNVNAGQAAVVVSADQAPVVMPATDEEIQEHENDTDPTVTGDGGGGGDDGGEPQAFVADEEADGEDPLTPPEPEPLPEVYVPPTVEETTGGDFTLFSSVIDLGGGLSATLGGQVGDTTNLGAATLSGDAFTSVPSFGGTMDNGAAFQGTIGGQPGTWEGLFATIWQNGSQVGYLYSALSDPAYAGGPALSAGGPVRREARAGTFDTTAYPSLADAMFPVGLHVPTYTGMPGVPAVMAGVEVTVPTPAGVRLLSVWQDSESGTGTFAAGSGSLVYGAEAAPYSYYLGTINYDDDGAGHAAEGGLAGTADDPTGFDMDRIFYMDPEVMGEIGRMYRAAYDPATGDYEAFGAGTATLDPLAVSGPWGMGIAAPPDGAPQSLYSPDAYTPYPWGVDFDPVAHETGVIGGIYAPWSGEADFTAIGQYFYTGPGYAGGGYLWNSPVMGYGTTMATATAQEGRYSGYTGGYWTTAGLASGTMSGRGAIVYLNDGYTAGGIALADVDGFFYEGVGGMPYDAGGMFKAEGSWIPDPARSAAGLDPASVALSGSSFGGALAGPHLANGWSPSNVDGTGSFIIDNGTGAALPWGVYSMHLETLYDPATLPLGAFWTAAAGGQGSPGYGGGLGGGYWWGDISWTWNADTTIAGSFTSGEYITDQEIGTFTGPVWGLWGQADPAGYGGAVGQSIGVYDAQPLAFGVRLGATTLYLPDAMGYATSNGHEMGLAGSALAPWVGPAPFTAIGTYDLDSSAPKHTWYSDVYALDYSDRVGFIAGRWADGGIDAATAGLYRVAPGETGVLLAGSALGGGPVSGDYRATTEGEMTGGIWRGHGTLVSEPMQAAVGGEVTIESGWMDAYAEGAFGSADAPQGSIFGEWDTSDTLYYASAADPSVTESWGVFGMLLGDDNHYDREGSTADSWHGRIGGMLSIGGNEYDEGYFLLDVTDGVWTVPGDIDAGLAGDLITGTRIGGMTGKLFGQNFGLPAGSAPWIAAATGYYESEPLAFLSIVDYASDWDEGPYYGLYAGYGGGPGYGGGLETWGDVYGYGGSATAPWRYDDGQGQWVPQTVTDLLILGEAWGDDDRQQIWNDEFYSYNAVDGGYGAYVGGGAFTGFVGGAVSDGEVDARVALLYVDPDGDAGTMVGSLTGGYYPDIGMIRAEGGMTPVQRAAGTGFDVEYDVVTNNFQHAFLAGDFAGSGYLEADLPMFDGYYGGWTRYFTDQGWGVYDLILDGFRTYDNPAGANVYGAGIGGRAAFGGYGGGPDWGYFLADVAGDWAGGTLEGELANGRFLTPNRYGVIEGDLVGYYDDEGHWAGTSLGDFRTTVEMAFGNELGRVYLGSDGFAPDYRGSGPQGIFGLDGEGASANLYAMGDVHRFGYQPVISLDGYDSRIDASRLILLDLAMTGGELIGNGVGLYAYGSGEIWYGGYLDVSGITATPYADLAMWEGTAAVAYDPAQESPVAFGAITGDSFSGSVGTSTGLGQFGYGDVAGDTYYLPYLTSEWGVWRAAAGYAGGPFGLDDGYWLAVANGTYEYDGAGYLYGGGGIGWGIDPNAGDNGRAYRFPVTMGTAPADGYAWYVDGTLPAGTDLAGWAMFGNPPLASIYNYDTSDMYFAHQGAFMGLMGLMPGDGPERFDVLAMGDWYQDSFGNPYDQYVFLEPVHLSGDPLGYGGGVLRRGAMNGNLAGLYEDEAGAYVLFGELTGDVHVLYPGEGGYGGMWVAQGGVAKVGLPDLSLDTLQQRSMNLYGGGPGLYANATQGGFFGMESPAGDRQGGVWQAMLGGSHSDPGPGWALFVEGVTLSELFGSVSSEWLVANGDEWSWNVDGTGDMRGDVAGAWVDLEDALTGVMGGELKGTFDPGNWQAVALGTFIDTQTFFEKLSSDVDALRALNIPSVAIGSADLTGNDGDLFVAMHDVTFFARNTGAVPAIWASERVDGTYTNAPQAGVTSVGLSGSSADATLNASFDVTQWKPDGNWSAAVDGGGTVATHDISFTGAAAGKDFGANPTTNLEGDTIKFSGTAAGVVGSGME